MEEVIASIIEKINFKRKDEFSDLLNKSMYSLSETAEEAHPNYDTIMLKIDVFFKGFDTFHNEFGKDKKYESGVEALSVMFEELGVEIEKTECFIIFHLKDLGKFRIKETKLHNELKSAWGQYKHYKLEDGDFSYALKSLMRKKLIYYRRGTIQLKPSILLRYRIEE